MAATPEAGAEDPTSPARSGPVPAQPAGETHLIGTLGSDGRAEVDARGAVRPGGAPWWLTWSVGAEDRWHEARTSVAVRQQAVGDVAVFETAMRVPGGDVFQRVYGVHLSGIGGAAVVEFENRSAVPVALALAAVDAEGGQLGVRADGARLLVDGRAVAVAAREPARAETEHGLVFALTHTAVLRVVLPLDQPVGSGLAFPGTIPPIERVVAGWHAQIDRGVRVVLPDAALQGRLDRWRAQLLLSVGDDAIVDPRVSVTAVSVHDELAVAGALRAWGFAEEGDRLLLGVVSRFVERARADRDPAAAQALVSALDRHWAWHRDEDVRDATAFGRAEAERVLRRRAAPPTVPAPVGPGMIAHRLSQERRSLVRSDEDGVALLEVVPPAWFGQALEVHDAPTWAGPCSFAVRWHGERPALLWEVDPHPGGAVRLCVPGLDPSWSTTEARGEALLAAPRSSSPSSSSSSSSAGPGASSSPGASFS